MDGSALNASMEGAGDALSDAVAQASRERAQQQRNIHMQQRMEVNQALHLQQHWQHMEATAVAAAQQGAPIVECGRLNNGGGNGGGGGSGSAPQVGRVVHPPTLNEHALM
jgi:hypothetical protein